MHKRRKVNKTELRFFEKTSQGDRPLARMSNEGKRYPPECRRQGNSAGLSLPGLHLRVQSSPTSQRRRFRVCPSSSTRRRWRGCAVLGREALRRGPDGLCPQRAPGPRTKVMLVFVPSPSHVTNVAYWKGKQGKGETCSAPSSPHTRISHQPISHTQTHTSVNTLNSLFLSESPRPSVEWRLGHRGAIHIPP